VRALLLAACGLLGACQTLPAPKTVCLPLKPYTTEEQARLGAQLAVLPSGSDLVGAILDYQRMRDADRACLAAKP